LVADDATDHGATHHADIGIALGLKAPCDDSLHCITFQAGHCADVVPAQRDLLFASPHKAGEISALTQREMRAERYVRFRTSSRRASA
jgi:hypothetical protein